MLILCLLLLGGMLGIKEEATVLGLKDAIITPMEDAESQSEGLCYLGRLLSLSVPSSSHP